jgi:cytochrome c oxidase assembly factor CtaG
MSSAIQSVFAEWSLPPWLTIAVILTACVYLRGGIAVRKTRPAQFTLLRLSSFLVGLAVLWVAIASPLDGFADALLSAHMVQHLLLMSVVPPLVLLGRPVVPLLRGFPELIRKPLLDPLLRLPELRRLGRWLISPLVAWMAMNLTFVGWHVPAAYDFALENEHWHEFEHICFLSTSLMFWWCIIRPWPAERRRNNWGLLLYLLSADLVNTALSAFLAFCDWPVYTHYVSQPRAFPVAPISDQVLGAVIMWVVGSFAFLTPAALITVWLVQAPQPVVWRVLRANPESEGA